MVHGQLACGAGRWQEFVGVSEGERSQLAENSFPSLVDSSSPVATKGGGFKRHPIKALTGAKARCVYLLADMKSALRGQ
ncbi:MAG: hypothetical protein DMG39_11640 [Acidobacteria bacterium]|nr:MAG: hypothetical protein DMG39_11640 [Acidobacteriota bacterium]